MPVAEAKVPTTSSAADSNVQGAYTFPLTVFEKFMLLDGRADYPANFFVHLKATGKIDRNAFERALQAALVRQPLLHARAGKVKGEYLWTVIDQPELPLIWTTPGELYPQQSDRIQLERDIGLRVRATEDQEHTEIVFEFHHACVDGLGAYRFIGEVLTAYDVVVNGVWPPAWEKINLQRLQDRGFWPPPADAPPFGPRVLGIILREAWLFFWRRPTPLKTKPQSSRSKVDTLVQVSRLWQHRFSVAESNAIRAAAGNAQVTANDLLLCAMFLALDDWNQQHGDQRRRKYMRINMPTSVDERYRDGMPACNQLSMAFITRKRCDCDNVWTLLKSIHTETSLIRRWNLGSFFLDGLKFVNRFKGLLGWLLSFERTCFATAVLSNIGDVSRRLYPATRRREQIVWGKLTLRSLVGAPPVRPQTHFSVAVMSYQRQLSIIARTNPIVFDKLQSQELFDLYLNRIMHLVKMIESHLKGGQHSDEIQGVRNSGE